MTNVANRRMLEEKSSEEWRRAVRYQYPINPVMIDVDRANNTTIAMVMGWGMNV